MQSATERIRHGLLTAAIVLPAFGAVPAQTVPEIADVYATPESETRELGPTRDPAVILDRVGVATEGLRALRYDVDVVDPLRSDGLRLVGNVLLDFGSLDARDAFPPRYRASIRGRDPEGRDVAAVFAFDGRRRFTLDLLERRATEDAPEPAWLRDYVLLPLAGVSALERPDRPGPVYLGPVDVADEPCYLVHYPSRDAGAHVYGYFSQNDAWPRKIEHVRGSAIDRPTIVEASFANLVENPPINTGQFEPFVPEGFEPWGENAPSR